MDEYSSSIPMTARHLGVANWLDVAHRIARREVRDLDLADDIAQTALERLFLLDAAPRNIPAWLTTAIQRLAIDHHRRKEFRRVEPDADLDDRPGWGTLSGRVVKRDAIANVLAGLSSRHQRALMMSAEGFTNSEIAEELHFASAATVAATLSRLRRQLREQRHADEAAAAALPAGNNPPAGDPSHAQDAVREKSDAKSPQATEGDQIVASSPFLYEDHVVSAVVAHLKDHGWTIKSTAFANQRGDDVVAERGGECLRIEAKGAGSSKKGTRRFGQAFTRNQVRSHVSVAVHRALRVWSNGADLAGLAFPDNDHHREMVASIQPALSELGIKVFWVDDERRVTASIVPGER